MKTSNSILAATISGFTMLFAVTGSAQDVKTPANQDAQHQEMQRPRDMRPDLIHKLGLSTEQMEQIHRINVERRPLMDGAQKRLREANRSLDAAIYADNVNEAEIDARLKDVQEAQADVARIRFTNELAVRRVLTPEQLARFREMRQKFEQARQNFRKLHSPDDGRPVQRRRRDGNATPDAQAGPESLSPNTPRPEF